MRYIDADALIENILKLKIATDDMYGMGIARGIERAETAIQMQPTADVAPKSEVAREIFKEIAETCVPETPEERGRETQIGYLLGVNAFLKNILELKQKYTKNP